MAIPELDIFDYEPSENHVKLNLLIYALCSMNYDVYDARSCLKIIEKYQLNTSQFTYPYDSFDEFKKHTLSGEFDVDMRIPYTTEQKREELKEAAKNGRLWY